MRAVCFESPENVSVRSIDDSKIECSGDAIVQVSIAGLCGSDIHAFFGRESGLDVGTAMGHEFVGHVIAVGDDVRNYNVGDRVCAPFTTNCGHCFYCRSGLTSRCQHGQLFGWRESSVGLHGGQAEQVRVPLADSTLMKVPNHITDETALLLGDNLSTAHFCASMADIQNDGVYAVVGCGTVGLLTIAAAKRLGADQIIAVDLSPARLAIAKQLGATVFNDGAEAIATAQRLTDGRGADAVMELVGLPAAQRLAVDLVRPGGTLSVIGCHCTPNFAFSPVEAYDKNLTYRTGRCPARHIMTDLAKDLSESSFDLSWCITHQFDLDDAVEAYDTFAHRKDNCIKAVINFGS